MSLFSDPQASLGFPAPLAEKYRPRSIDAFIGLEKQRKVLSAFARRPVSCAWLFIGPSGVGKSTMALALADELQADLHKIPSQKCTVQAIAAQLALLSKLDSTDPAPQTIWIFTANDCERLEKRFLSRCRVLEFSSYGMRGELASFLAQVWRSETGTDGAIDFERVAKNSTNNVRDALQTLEVELLAS